MNKLLSIGFSIVIFALLVLSILYVGFRLQKIFGLNSLYLVQFGVAVGVIGAMATIVIAVKSSSQLVGILNIIGGYIFTFYIFLFFALIFFHAIQTIWNLPMAWSGTVALALSLIVTVVGALLGNSFVVNEKEIKLSGLKSEVDVMLISDVHLGHHRSKDYLAKIVEETNRRKPDLVLITGDLIDSEAALLPGVLNPLSDFAAPTYFVGGNHEKYIDNERTLQLIESHGIRVLRNEVVEIQGLQLVGFDYMNADEDTFDMHPSDDTRTIKSVLPSIPLKSDMPSVLMHHSPVGVQYAATAGIDLMVSGHTHAGQVFPFTLFNEITFPFNKGLHQHDKTKVFVSQGAGTYMLRARLGTSNEINMLRLISEGV
ncbi:metallophosphoesterase [Alkaliphilus metalliredigens QYMF]|uniref:Metallophosphoesterase n=1 Tax=Alkaliphilus metalliredigens (strain QYMF) TaxID=293826 RepID=A6TP36_ALKMQ|nr:metallophosphoesterase [Alkaliphilus metalliredigens]ABR47954.1 metallophosphoesterase [Alkaliphilus metalliredigens QYMF]